MYYNRCSPSAGLQGWWELNPVPGFRFPRWKLAPPVQTLSAWSGLTRPLDLVTLGMHAKVRVCDLSVIKHKCQWTGERFCVPSLQMLSDAQVPMHSDACTPLSPLSSLHTPQAGAAARFMLASSKTSRVHESVLVTSRGKALASDHGANMSNTLVTGGRFLLSLLPPFSTPFLSSIKFQCLGLFAKLEAFHFHTFVIGAIC